jgi:hypothetical protein
LFPEAQLVESNDEWLLWPAVAYRIVLPVKRERRLDLFERVVLQLCRAGKWDVDEVAGQIHLDRELILYVVGQLQARGYVDGGAEPTPLGLASLGGVPVTESEQLYGLVYQSPWTGRVWPRFTDRAPLVLDVRWSSRRRAMLQFGSAGKPVRRRATTVEGDWPEPTATEDDIRQVLRHAFADRDGQAVLPSGVVLEPTRLDRLSIASDGENVLLAAPMYNAGETRVGSATPVLDPALAVPSDDLAELLAGWGEEDSVIRELLARVAAARPPLDQVPTVPGSDTRLAAKRLIERFGDRIIRSPLYERCIEFERAYLAVAAASDETRGERFRSVVTEAQALLEAAFQVLLTLFPCDEAADGLVGGDYKTASRTNIPMLKQEAKTLGASSLPHRMASINKSIIQSALKSRNESVRALVVATMLIARRLGGHHPMRLAVQRDPLFFERIDGVAQLRNETSAHAGASPPSREQLENAMRDTYAVLHLIDAAGMPRVAT